MDEVIKWMAFALQLLPLVLRGVTLAEDTIGPGNGTQKKALVTTALMSAVPPGTDTALGSTVVSKMIDGVVGPLTLTGKLLPHGQPVVSRR